MCMSEALGACELGCAREGWEGKSTDVHVGEAAGGLSGPRKGSGGLRACPHDESKGSKCGWRGPGRGWEGMAVCTSEALEACELGCAGEGLGGRIRRCACRRGSWGPLGPERGFGGFEGMST